MSRRTFAVAAVVLMWVSPVATREVGAQDRAPVRVQAQLFEPITLLGDLPTVAEPQIVPASSAQMSTSAQMSIPLREQIAPKTSRPSSGGMWALYASTAAMQALDVHSSLTGFKSGAVEANPIMKGITKSPGAFVAVKAAVATGTILAARQIAKRNKLAAAVMLVAVNSVYAFVAVHNYKVASSLR